MKKNFRFEINFSENPDVAEACFSQNKATCNLDTCELKPHGKCVPLEKSTWFVNNKSKINAYPAGTVYRLLEQQRIRFNFVGEDERQVAFLARQFADQRGMAQLLSIKPVQHRLHLRINLEDRTGAHQIDEVAAAGGKAMIFGAAIGGGLHDGHRDTSGWSKR